MLRRALYRVIFITGCITCIQLSWWAFALLFPGTHASVLSLTSPITAGVDLNEIEGFDIALNQDIIDYEIDESDLQDTYTSIDNLTIGERVKWQLRFITKASKIRNSQLAVIQESLDSHK